jgi:hypothetical protein
MYKHKLMLILPCKYLDPTSIHYLRIISKHLHSNSLCYLKLTCTYVSRITNYLGIGLGIICG